MRKKKSFKNKVDVHLNAVILKNHVFLWDQICSKLIESRLKSAWNDTFI